MKLKIIVLMILVLVSINNVNCESGNGSIDLFLQIEDSHTVFSGGNDYNIAIMDFNFNLDHETGGNPDSYYIDYIDIKNRSDKTYGSIPSNLGDPFYIYWSETGVGNDELVGYGSVLIHKNSYDYTDEVVEGSIIFYFDEFTKKEGVSGVQIYRLDGSWSGINSYYDKYYKEYGTPYKNDFLTEFGAVITLENPFQSVMISHKTGFDNVENIYSNFGSFRNDYDYTVTSSYFDIDIQRQGFNQSYDLSSSKIKMLNYTDDTIYYQSGFTTSNSSHFLGVGTYNYYIVRQKDDYEHLIYTSYEDEEEEEEQPTLTTDKTYYNTSEQITISYTNIDVIYDECISSFCNEAYQIWIYAIDPIEDIPKYRNWLYSDRRDETFTLNTSFLSPQTIYKLIITSGENNIMIESDIFYVYPDEEYLSVSCDSETTCYTYNNADITIYYQINNNSNIIIKDNDNNVINTYYNIIGNGSILYHIPDDLYYENTYPNWKVYLNNTEYSTSFNKGVIVYWSQFATPTPTSTFTPTPTPDINISDEIDNLKDEISPIKDLLFGLSEIVIDNPDYNKDNIVDENEINHWFNSLIPMCIILLLIILYIGLKKNRND